MKVLVPNIAVTEIKALPVFEHSSFLYTVADDQIVDFLNAFSRKVIKEPQFRKDPSFIALGFWLRKGNLKQIISENTSKKEHRFSPHPLGIVFHLCPSNVDTMFFYSLTLALLGGNKNVIRVSSRMDDPLVFRLFEILNDLLNSDEYAALQQYINIVTYDRNDAINEAISIRSDARVIWGGDETIQQFKSYQTKQKVKDLYFADRVSYTLINTAAQADEEAKEQLVKDLFTDVYTFDQMGCSSPHCLFFIGDKASNDNLKSYIYEQLSLMAQEAYERDLSSMASFKFNKATDDIIEEHISSVVHDNNYLVFSKIETTVIPHSCGMGYLYYATLDSLDQIVPYLNEKTQTLGYWGFSKEDLQKLDQLCPPNVVDRIVPVGKALEFDHIWDGYDIYNELIKYRSIR